MVQATEKKPRGILYDVRVQGSICRHLRLHLTTKNNRNPQYTGRPHSEKTSLIEIYNSTQNKAKQTRTTKTRIKKSPLRKGVRRQRRRKVRRMAPTLNSVSPKRPSNLMLPVPKNSKPTCPCKKRQVFHKSSSQTFEVRSSLSTGVVRKLHQKRRRIVKFPEERDRGKETGAFPWGQDPPSRSVNLTWGKFLLGPDQCRRKERSSLRQAPHAVAHLIQSGSRRRGRA